MFAFKVGARHIFFRVIVLFITVWVAYGCSKPPAQTKPPDPPSPTPPATTISSADVLTLNETTGKIFKAGKEYYGAGVNYYDAFYRVIIDPTHADTSYKNGIRILGQKKIPFFRFSLLAYYPNDLNYYKNSESDFFNKLDAFVKFAEDNNVGLIPSFFWNYSAIPDYVGEKVGTWGRLNEPGNKTNEFITAFVQKMVDRYGKRKGIWAWEFGNEVNLHTNPAKMTFANQPWLYPIVSATGQGGLPTTRSYDDTLHTRDLNSALDKFQSLIRAAETKAGVPARAIFSGNGLPNWGSYSRHYGVWGGNTKEEYETIMLMQNGNLGTVSIHPYLNHEATTGYNTTMSNIISGAKSKCDGAKKALFIGEYGVPESYTGDKTAKFREYVDAIKAKNIQLSAIWLYDPLGRATGYMKDWCVTPAVRGYQLDGIVEINDHFKSKQ